MRSSMGDLKAKRERAPVPDAHSLYSSDVRWVCYFNLRYKRSADDRLVVVAPDCSASLHIGLDLHLTLPWRFTLVSDVCGVYFGYDLEASADDRLVVIPSPLTTPNRLTSLHIGL